MAGQSIEVNALAPENMATEICSLYETWRDLRSRVEDRWLEVRQYLYATSTQETSNFGVGGFSSDPDARRGWSHSTHIPKLTQISDNLAANYMMAMFSKPKWVEWYGNDKESVNKRKREIAQAYVLTKARMSNFRNEIQKCIDDWIQTGNCFGMIEYVKETHVDPDTGVPDIAYQGPVLRRISPYDIVFNPLATSFKRSPKIVYSIKSIGELIREAEENPELAYNLEIVEKCKELRKYASSKGYDKYLNKLRHLDIQGYGSPTEYLKSGYVEILEFYGDIYNAATGEFLKNHVVTIVDRSWVIRQQPIKSYDGAPYLFHCGWRTRPESLWAMGPLENLVGLQYMINHLQNTKADAFDEFVVPTIVTVGDVEEEGEKFGGLMAQRYHIDSADGRVEAIRPDPAFLQADLQIQYLEALMEAYAGSPREAMGIRTPGEKTAFEFQQLINAAGRIFQNKIDYFSEEFLEKVANSFIEQARIYLDSRDVVQVTDDDFGAVEFKSISKTDLKASGKLVPVGSRHFAEKARLAQTLQTLNAVLGDEEKLHISSIDLAKAFLESSDVEDILQVTPYVRLQERADASRVNNVLVEQVGAEAAVAL